MSGRGRRAPARIIAADAAAIDWARIDLAATGADGIANWLRLLAALDEEVLRRELRKARRPILRSLFEAWFWQAHGGQREPAGDWRVWLMMAGRGFGKTRAGAEWVSARARAGRDVRIALVGATVDEALAVMIEGESGLKAVARTGERPHWIAGTRELHFASGAIGQVFSGAAPEKLRGPQHHFAWCDEIAKWRHGSAAWDNLMLGLRLGAAPQAVVTTTPKMGPTLARVLATPGLVRTGGRSHENAHVSRVFLEQVQALYGGTHFGRQELDGELIGEADGSLWPRMLIEASRCARTAAMLAAVPAGTRPAAFARIVIGVDPPASEHGDACGIVAAAVDAGGTGYVIGDHSVAGRSPEGWARAVAAAAERWRVDRVVAEANQGGDMVRSVLQAAGATLPIRLVHARAGKAARAEPVAALFESGKARFAGAFPALEDELAGLQAAGGYQGPGRSPDRADAMVYALTALLLTGEGKPGLRPI